MQFNSYLVIQSAAVRRAWNPPHGTVDYRYDTVKRSRYEIEHIRRLQKFENDILRSGGTAERLVFHVAGQLPGTGRVEL